MGLSHARAQAAREGGNGEVNGEEQEMTGTERRRKRDGKTNVDEMNIWHEDEKGKIRKKEEVSENKG